MSHRHSATSETSLHTHAGNSDSKALAQFVQTPHETGQIPDEFVQTLDASGLPKHKFVYNLVATPDGVNPCLHKFSSEFLLRSIDSQPIYVQDHLRLQAVLSPQGKLKSELA